MNRLEWRRLKARLVLPCIVLFNPQKINKKVGRGRRRVTIASSWKRSSFVPQSLRQSRPFTTFYGNWKAAEQRYNTNTPSSIYSALNLFPCSHIKAQDSHKSEAKTRPVSHPWIYLFFFNWCSFILHSTVLLGRAPLCVYAYVCFQEILALAIIILFILPQMAIIVSIKKEL